MQVLYLNVFIYSAFNIIFGLYSHFIKESLFLSESLVSMAFGIILGCVGYGIVFPKTWNDDTLRFFHQLARFVMTFQTMAAGISLPKAYLSKRWWDLLMLLGPVMLSMWFISSLIIYSIFRFTLLESLALAACITPTDPVLASSIVKGRFAEEHIPEHVRDLLSAESGANDGAAMPLLYLPIILINSGPSRLLKDWIILIWIKGIVMAIIFGACFGFAANRLLKHSQYRDLIDKQSFIAFSLALSLLIMAMMNLLGCNDMIAIFVAGAVFAWDDWFIDQTRESQLQPAIDSIFNTTFFVMFGAALPWDKFNHLGLQKLLVLTVLVLLFRRLPVIWLIGPLKEKRERLFAGWFGPIGVGAIFYAITLSNYVKYHEDDRFITITCFIVMSSVIGHGITVPLFHATMTRQITLDMIRIDYWTTFDLDSSRIEIDKEEIIADLITRK